MLKLQPRERERPRVAIAPFRERPLPPVEPPSDSSRIRGIAAGILAGVLEQAHETTDLPSPRRVAWEYIFEVVRLFGGNHLRAAKALGIERRQVQRVMNKRAPRR
jgi:ActR/RegA family two-component response regulator